MATVRRIARYIYVGASWLALAALFVPLFFAGMALFVQRSFWAGHIEMGYGSGLPLLLLIIFGIVSWIPRRLTATFIGMTVLHFVHTALPTVRETLPMVAAAHPVTAVLLTGFTLYHARMATRMLLDRGTVAEPSVAAAEAS